MPASTISNSNSVSWRTDSPETRSVAPSVTRSAPPSLGSVHNGSRSYVRRYVNVASASNSGMKFQSWREPKPLRSRPATAIDPRLPVVRRNPIKRCQLDAKVEDNVNYITNRLSTPTFATKMKNIKAHPKTSMLNMNFYSWANMAVYRDYQKTLYKKDGTMRRNLKK